MDEPRRDPGYEEDPARKAAGEGDAIIYIFALIATIAIVAGLFAWERLDPVLPPTSPPTANQYPSEIVVFQKFQS